MTGGGRAAAARVDERPLPERAWKAPRGRSRTAASAEQDRVAGGRHRRVVPIAGGEALGTVELRRRASGSVHAYLRWTDGGQVRARYLCAVDQPSRIKNLAAGWEHARIAGLVRDETRAEGSWASSPDVRASMRGNRGRDTAPEMRLRSLLHARGLRYRVSTRPVAEVRRTADVVFPRAKVAVFVDGCYWHGCPEHYRPASTNAEFWRRKIEGNKQRDETTNRLLGDAGWTVIRAWEHEDPVTVAEQVARAVRTAGAR